MQNNFHSGFVALIGEPNVGKSTLMNRILGSEISIISPKSQTTRNKIQGIYTTDKEQIIFVDTPGIHQPRNSLDKYMDTAAFSVLQDVDLVLLMVNVDTKIDSNIQDIMKRLKNISQPLFLVINKIDLIHPDSLLPLIDQYNNILKFQEIIPISATQGNNVAELLKTIIQYLPKGPQYYSKEQLSDHPEYFVIEEIIREKILELTHQEVPHSVAVVVEQMNQHINGKLQIDATIYTERTSQKKILIGQKGTMIKNIGIRSREKIERLLDEKINLKLWIKVQKNWRNDPLFLKRVGYQLKDLQ